MEKFYSALSRKKTIDVTDTGTKLARVLTITDLTALGVGSTLGLGVYVLAGSVAKTVAGPAVCLSFLVAAIASGIAGLCYAEFASRVPRAGSAYVYSYVSVGEFTAFSIGWNLILEYVIGTASVARGMSGYVDALANDTMQYHLREIFPMNVDFLSPYPDFFSFGIVLLLTVLLSIGVKESTCLNNIFTLLNIITVCIVIVAGSANIDFNNWNIQKEDIPPEFADAAGSGGFMPFGIAGVMAGAAKCFYGFVGFDCVATTGEEAKNPKRSIPIAIVLSLIIIFLAYFAISGVLTLMWPYYDQNEKAPFPYVFDQVGWTIVKWIVTTGAIFALCTSLLGAMFPLPRVLYAMANDGLIFSMFGSINMRTKTPLIATLLSGVFAGIMGAMFDLNQLIDMMSIGTLLAYTIVAMSVLILRYEENNPSSNNNVQTSPSIQFKQTQTMTPYTFIKYLFNLNMNKYPNEYTRLFANWSICIFTIISFAFCFIIIHYGHEIFNDNLPLLLIFILITTLLLISIYIISRQPASDLDVNFKVPCVPLLPCLSIIMNIYLMLELDIHTWIRFIVWLIIGYSIYFFYGISHSTEKKTRDMKKYQQKMDAIHNQQKAANEVTKF
ncbi:cationic amino acid transporter 3-like [Chrysoperla carnea]|uniref:cationic amino acid transporter 3-like n=1 Tax=Chrysoperla carnea TaxID=189513 RepID=UPI001D097C53|nr:cationic amino acid transporter 3-like [Chrysoperla carnea]